MQKLRHSGRVRLLLLDLETMLSQHLPNAHGAYVLAFMKLLIKRDSRGH